MRTLARSHLLIWKLSSLVHIVTWSWSEQTAKSRHNRRLISEVNSWYKLKWWWWWSYSSCVSSASLVNKLWDQHSDNRQKGDMLTLERIYQWWSLEGWILSLSLGSYQRGAFWLGVVRSQQIYCWEYQSSYWVTEALHYNQKRLCERVHSLTT